MNVRWKYVLSPVAYGLFVLTHAKATLSLTSSSDPSAGYSKKAHSSSYLLWLVTLAFAG
jgi:hypothetical protein